MHVGAVMDKQLTNRKRPKKTKGNCLSFYINIHYIGYQRLSVAIEVLLFDGNCSVLEALDFSNIHREQKVLQVAVITEDGIVGQPSNEQCPELWSK